MAGTEEHSAAPATASLPNGVAHKKRQGALESFVLVGQHLLETRFQFDLKTAAEREVEKLDNLYLQRGSERCASLCRGSGHQAVCVSVKSEQAS